MEANKQEAPKETKAQGCLGVIIAIVSLGLLVMSLTVLF